MKRPRLLNPFKVEIPSAIERLLSLNLKFIIRPKINVVAPLESFKELRTTVRRRSRFLNAPVKTGRDRYVPGLHVKSTLPYTWPKADETVEKGLDRGFLLLRQALDSVDSTRWRPNLAGATLPSLEGFMNSNNVLEKASLQTFSLASLYQYTPFSAEKFVHQLNEDQIQLPEFHMLPKMHKVKLAGRPIVPSHSWVTSHVSKYADWLLQPMLQLFPWIIQDSKDLLRRLSDVELPEVNEELWIITADIQSMYTNLPSDEGARCMRWLGTHFYTQEHLPFSQRLPPILAPMFEDFLDSGSENFGFGSAPSSELFNTETLREQTAGDLIYELVSFVLNNSYLGFQGKLFHQVSGTAMGTALAPTYANLFVGALEREARLLETPNLIFYGRYIDDVIAIVKGPRSNVDICISALAQLHPSLVFDAEVSSNGLPFLDAFISKNSDPKNSSRWSLSTRVLPL
ncbi:BQ5605_C011g06381 [Microbotryum silenes-dioicae]|uniref:BQ5605_C011g06381 protein n=1 Tax=Microbotryum silenes-dioicae TaxID=796604 RepID=A0A2X0LSA1_9BASI|nr:BQ5605_C011g06381 [Microbotryum silenes-dioicae]